MGVTLPLAPKQLEFLLNSNAKWNFAHGSVRAGKTYGITFRFLQAVNSCPDDNIWIAGKSSTTIYNNVISVILNAPQFTVFRPFVSWQGGKNILHFVDSKGRHKKIKTVGIKDKGAIGYIQGTTMSIFYGDEMTLYPPEVIALIDTRLSCPWSVGFGTMNPTYPTHLIKQWIDAGLKGDKNYYSLHYTLDDNPYVDEEYKARIAKSTGIFYKRNYLGLWCLAEGAIFDFFDKDLHVRKTPPRAVDYFIAGIDVGTSNAFACLVVGVSIGKNGESGAIMWVENEYFWDFRKTQKAKTNLEYANDLEAFLEPYGCKVLYIDPSAAAMKEELRRKGMHTVDANNDVYNGITHTVSLMNDGNLLVLNKCINTIREIESYVWDMRASERGDDEPLKQDDHCFMANTRIYGIDGPISIQNVEKGDEVLTTKGFKKVLETHSLEAQIFRYSLYGTNLRCTANHKIFTCNRGWVEIQSLTLSDILCKMIGTWNKKLASNLKAKNIEDIPILSDILTEHILNAEVDISIEPYMKKHMEAYQKDVIYITRTGIPLTMIFPIWSLSLENNISKFIKKILILIISRNMQEMVQKNGINPTKEENGTENTRSKIILEEIKKSITHVNNVEQSLSHLKKLESDFVQISVNQNGEETVKLIAKKKTVLNVINYLLFPNIQQLLVAHSLVPKKYIGITKVYDLTVEDAHSYFANGLLVHNCMDALRYAVFTHKPSLSTNYIHSPNDYLKNRFGPRNF